MTGTVHTFHTPDFLEQIFDHAGIPTVREAIETGDMFDVGPESVRRYAEFAATCLRAGNLTHRGGNLRDATVRTYAKLLVAAFAIDSPDYVERDGDPYIRGDLLGRSGELIPLTPDLVRHWETLMSLAGDDDTCRLYLDALPHETRREATTAARQPRHRRAH